MKLSKLVLLSGLGVLGYFIYRGLKPKKTVAIAPEKMKPGMLYKKSEALRNDLIPSRLIPDEVDAIMQCPNCKSIIGFIEPPAGKVFAQVMTDLKCPVCDYTVLQVGSAGYKLIPISKVA